MAQDVKSIPAEVFKEWATKIQRSDQKAFEALFNAMHGALVGYAAVYTRSKPAANDVVQDVFVKLWSMRESVDPERSLKALLYQMVRNKALNHLRDNKQHTSIEAVFSLSDDTDNPHQDLHYKNLEKKINEWIEMLPNRQKEAFCLSRFEELSHQEISEVMDCRPRTVNNHIVLALKFLKNKLEAYQATTNYEL